jgi:hypothetical protein
LNQEHSQHAADCPLGCGSSDRGPKLCARSMIGISRSGISLFITQSSTNHRIRPGISQKAESRMTGRLGKRCLIWHASIRVYAFLFVLQQNRPRPPSPLKSLSRVAARRELDAITMRLQSRLAKLQHLWTVVDAEQSRGVHGHILLWA